MSTLKQILEAAANDPQARARLQANPDQVLREAGIQVPAGTTVELLDSRPDVLHLLLGSQVAVPELARALERADREPAYKQRLLAQPKATLEEALGTKLPAGVQVRVHEPAPQRWLLPLPAPRQPEGELSDLELDAVAGGGVFKRIGQAIGNAFCGNSQTQINQEVTRNHGVQINIMDYSVTEDRTVDVY